MAEHILRPDVDTAPDVLTLKQRHNGLLKHYDRSHPKVIEAERALREARLAEHVRQVVEAAPPLSADAIERLRALLPEPAPA